MDVQHYIFRVALYDENDEITGETTAVIRFVKSGVTEVALDLTSLANGKGMTVTEVTADNGTVRYAHQSNRLVITLARTERG